MTTVRVQTSPHTTDQPRSRTTAVRYDDAPSSPILAFIERHETLVQLLPFFLAAALLLLSLVSQEAADIVQRLDVTKTK